MKRIVLFLCLLFFPMQGYCESSKKECKALHKKILYQKENYERFFNKFINTPMNEYAKREELLKMALLCCEKAYVHNERFFDGLGREKSLWDFAFWRAWRGSGKLSYFQNQVILLQQKNEFKKLIFLEKMRFFYEQSQEKASFAESMGNDPDLAERVSSLYKEAALLSAKTLEYVVEPAGVPEQQVLNGNIAFYEMLSSHYKAVATKRSLQKKAAVDRLTGELPGFSKEVFKEQEKKRREIFFKGPQLFSEKLFYAGSFSSFHRDSLGKVLLVQVFQEGCFLWQEQILLPSKEEIYKEGMLFVPKTALKDCFGLELRIDPLSISYKSMVPEYQFSFSFDQGPITHSFTSVQAPPWQFGALCGKSYDLYHLFPEEYASPERFIDRYLQKDEAIMKWAVDATFGEVFLRFAFEEFRKRALCYEEVCGKEGDFPSVREPLEMVVYSFMHPENKIVFPLKEWFNGFIPFRFEGDLLYIHGQRALLLEPSDLSVGITIDNHEPFILSKGAEARLCFHTSKEGKDLLSFIGERYFSQSLHLEKRLAALHHTDPITKLGVGLFSFYEDHLQIDVRFERANSSRALSMLLAMDNHSRNELITGEESKGGPFIPPSFEAEEVVGDSFVIMGLCSAPGLSSDFVLLPPPCKPDFKKLFTPRPTLPEVPNSIKTSPFSTYPQNGPSYSSSPNHNSPPKGYSGGGVGSIFPQDPGEKSPYGELFYLPVYEPPPPPPPRESLIPPAWEHDVRPENKSIYDYVSDPVDVITGAFYLDEVDLPGFIEIRRNYNSQNPLTVDCGAGWKLSLNPYLVLQEGKFYAAEKDGTVVVYSFNEDKKLWEVLPCHNPKLMGSCLHSYIQDNILYGGDGSIRIFEEGLLQKWIYPDSRFLVFSYDRGKLSRIESSNGFFCTIAYDLLGRVCLIDAQEGRLFHYYYDEEDNLSEVTLPNGSCLFYEYDYLHRMIRETKPHGYVVENIYDEKGRVVEQRTMGSPYMEAKVLFLYEEGQTCVIDPLGGQTSYQIIDGKICTITDPLGEKIRQSWGVHGLTSFTDKRGATRRCVYDGNGDLVEVIVDGESSVSKKYCYNSDHLCISEEVLGEKSLITYDSVFPYLPKKIDNGFFVIEYVYDDQGRMLREENDGSIRSFAYDARGFLSSIRRETGTEDPDVVTFYRYDRLGRVVEVITEDSRSQNSYDIMGNLVLSEVYSLSGTLLEWSKISYNLNNLPIRKENAKGVFHLDYNAAGDLKASRQEPSGACRLYDYDLLGNLIEQIDPLGHSTCYTYDALGQNIDQTSYEPGGFVAQTPLFKRSYTKTGLLAQELYPDGTKSLWEYDSLGRMTQEIKDGLTWQTEYQKKCTIRRCLESKEEKIYDLKDNLICYIDGAGHLYQKSYDRLGRLILEIAPTGEKTCWNYRGDTVICTLPSQEKMITRYEHGTPVFVQILGQDGSVLEESSLEKKEKTSVCEYDLLGRCIASTDGQGRKTCYRFDEKSRLVEKTFPGERRITYRYEDNLTTCCFPDGTLWEAAYDAMGRTVCEKIGDSLWSYTYASGNLQQKEDPLGQLHRYFYDLQGRVISETVGEYSRFYAYDEAGNLIHAEEKGVKEHSLVKRGYDASGRLIAEEIYLNGELVQTTAQSWGLSERTLEIGDHKRTYAYQNSRLTRLSSGSIDLVYSYDRKHMPFAEIVYNEKGLPELYTTSFLGIKQEERLEWDLAGRLVKHSSSAGERSFDYSQEGALVFPLQEKPFIYDAAGRVVSDGKRFFTWDPWDRLLQVATEEGLWEASYDVFGRRLETRSSLKDFPAIVTRSFYDPEEEFGEIGVSVYNHTYWKFQGLDSCDAVCDERGNVVFLIHDALYNLKALAIGEDIIWAHPQATPFGVQKIRLPMDLVAYAESLGWHSKEQELTGLIWMGARYYDPTVGRFLSQDPIGYPINIDLYSYAGKDPINFKDPDGRYANAAYDKGKSMASFIYDKSRLTALNFCYEPIKATALNIWNSPQFHGILQVGFGTSQILAGSTCTAATGGVGGLAGGGWLVFQGMDSVYTGARQIIFNEWMETGKSQALQAFGVSRENAEIADTVLGFLLPGSFTQGKSFFSEIISGKSAVKVCTSSNYRENLKKFTGINPSNNIDAHHVFPQKFQTRFSEKGINIHEPQYMAWWEKGSHLRAAKEYNNDWTRFFRDVPDFTKKQALEKGKELMKKHGIEVHYR